MRVSRYAMKKWIVRAAAAVFILTFFYFLLACGKKKEVLKLVPVSRGDIQERALAVGTIEPERETKLPSFHLILPPLSLLQEEGAAGTRLRGRCDGSAVRA